MLWEWTQRENCWRNNGYAKCPSSFHGGKNGCEILKKASNIWTYVFQWYVLKVWSERTRQVLVTRTLLCRWAKWRNALRQFHRISTQSGTKSFTCKWQGKLLFPQNVILSVFRSLHTMSCFFGCIFFYHSLA